MAQPPRLEAVRLSKGGVGGGQTSPVGGCTPTPAPVKPMPCIWPRLIVMPVRPCPGSSGTAGTLIRENHDPPADLAIEVVDEPLTLGPFALCHKQAPRPGQPTLADHVDPVYPLQGKGWQRRAAGSSWWVSKGADQSVERPATRLTGHRPASGHRYGGRFVRQRRLAGFTRLVGLGGIGIRLARDTACHAGRMGQEGPGQYTDLIRFKPRQFGAYSRIDLHRTLLS